MDIFIFFKFVKKKLTRYRPASIFLICKIKRVRVVACSFHRNFERAERVSHTLTNNVGIGSTYDSNISRRAAQRQNIPITRPRLYAPKCLSVYNSIVIRGASQMPGIICIVIPFARPRDLYCAAWRDGMQLTHIWSFSLRIRNAWVVTVVTASRCILKNRASPSNRKCLPFNRNAIIVHILLEEILPLLQHANTPEISFAIHTCFFFLYWSKRILR